MKYDYLIVLLLAVLALSSRVESQCPTNATLIKPCQCSELENGFNVTCQSNPYGRDIQTAVKVIGEHGPIASLHIYDIRFVFDYVENDMLSGNQIPDVTITCDHGFYGENTPLGFNTFAFKSYETGVCTLTGKFLVRNCVLKHFTSGEIFSGCDKLETIEFRDNYLNDFSRFPRLDNLKSVAITSNKYWLLTADYRLRSFEITELPGLKYLDLSYSSLRDQYVRFISDLTTVEEIYLSGKNNLTKIPDLTKLKSLRNFDISLNEPNANLTIALPAPRESESLNFVAKANYSQADNYTYVSALTGDLNGVDVSLLFPVEYLNESIFYEPLSNSTNGSITLSSEPSLVCKCDVAWLIRDHPQLLKHIEGGVCTDGKPLRDVGAETLKCCPVDSLVKRNDLQELKIHRLEDENRQLREQLQSHRL